MPPSDWYQLLYNAPVRLVPTADPFKTFSRPFVSQLGAAGYCRLGSSRQTAHLTIYRLANSQFCTSFVPLFTPSTALSIKLFLRPSSFLSYFFPVKIMQVNVVPKQNNTEHGTCARDQATPRSQSRGVQKVSLQPVTSLSAGSTCVSVIQQTWCNMQTVRGCSWQVDAQEERYWQLGRAKEFVMLVAAHGHRRQYCCCLNSRTVDNHVR
jgi:hypothetical protein